MARVIWSIRALDELEAAVKYIERNAPMAAKRFLKRVFARAQRLERSPRLGGFVAEDASRTYRQLIIGNYRIIHRMTNDDVRIVAFRHAARLLHVDDLE